MVQSDRSNSIWHNYIIITWRSWSVLFVSAANELAAQHSNTWLVLAVAVAARFRNPPPPQLHLYRSATGYSCMLYGGYFIYLICAAAVFLSCSQQHVVDVLAVASLGILALSQQRSRSIPPRPNTLTLPCTLPCLCLGELSWQNFYLIILASANTQYLQRVSLVNG